MIALVGTSSVGKTSTAEQLQTLLPAPHLVVGVDHFLNMFPQAWTGHPRGPGSGMWYEDTLDPDGSPRARIRYGSAGKRLLAGMRAAVRAMLDCGNHIILDEMPLDESILPAWRRELAGYHVTWVRLSAPLDVVEQREARRTRGQHLGNARGHFLIGTEEEYDLHLDVSTRSPYEVASPSLLPVSAEPRGNVVPVKGPSRMTLESASVVTGIAHRSISDQPRKRVPVVHGSVSSKLTQALQEGQRHQHE